MLDKYNRKINYMRLSITDKCNLRCQYCMPANGVKYIADEQLLTVDDIEKIASKLNLLGIDTVKLTGGEPLVRDDVAQIVSVLKTKANIKHVSLTTNGVLLDKHLDNLVAAGLDAITISIDSIDADEYATMTRRDQLARVIKNIIAAKNSNIANVKLNSVATHSQSEQSILNLIDFANTNHIPIRFIEMMPIGLGKNFQGYSPEQLASLLTKHFGTSKIENTKLGNGPASYYTYQKLNIPIGLISAVSNNFCANCNKIRVTSTGDLKQCLHYNYKINLRDLIVSECDLQTIADFIYGKPEKHAFGEQDGSDFEQLKMSDIGG